MFKNILTFVFVVTNVYSLWAVTAIYTASDIHYYANDLDPSVKEKSLNYLQAESGFDSMRQQIIETVKRKDTNIDSIAFVINGDPFNRSTDAVGGKPREDKPGFETKSISERKELIKSFANHVVDKITDGLECGDKNSMKNGHLKCEVTLSDGTKKSFDLAFKSNIGDHEIEKLPSTTNISEKSSVISELPEYCTNKIKLEKVNEINEFDAFVQMLNKKCGIRVANYMPVEKVLSKEGFNPEKANSFVKKLFHDMNCSKNITDYIEKAGAGLTYDGFHSELKAKCKIEVDSDSGNYLCKGATYKWANGDDVQKLYSVGMHIRDAWKDSNWYVPESEKTPLTMIDPRIGHIMVMQDGQPYIFSHVDKVLTSEEKSFQEKAHKKQGHLPQFQATVYKGFPDLDPRSDPRFANLIVFTGDSHVPRYSLPMAFAAEGHQQLARDLVTITATRNVINGGSLSSPLRQKNALNGYSSYVPGDKPKIISLNYTPDGGDEGYGYSKDMIGKWLAAKSIDERKEIEKEMIAALKNAKFVENNPSRHFQGKKMNAILTAYQAHGIRGLTGKLKAMGFTTRDNYLTTVKFLLKCGRNKTKSEVEEIFKDLYVGPDQEKKIDMSVSEQDRMSLMNPQKITDLRND